MSESVNDEEQGGGEEVEAPEESVEDLEPSEDDSDDVTGGFKRGWPS